jgi:hypothetical protein
MADIATEESSPTVLGSPRPDPANRFFEVTPDYRHIGPLKVSLTRAIHAFTFREDYTVSLVIRHLAPSQLEDALYVKRWLMLGNAVTMTTDDLDSNSYSGLTLAAGTTPEIKNDDDERQHFSFAVVLASDSPITVNYDG